MLGQESVESALPVVTEPAVRMAFSAKMLTELLQQAAECKDLVGREGNIERYTLVAKYDSEEHDWKGRLFCI